MANKKVIIANWKMQLSLSETIDLAMKIKAKFTNFKKATVAVCPNFISLESVRKILKGGPVKLGAQDVFWENKGPYTGEISPTALKEVGCEYVIIGHSERRKHLRENYEYIHKKIKAALNVEGLIPVVCIGETLEERDGGLTLSVLDRQIDAGLAGLTSEQVTGLVIAYEPVWAIGTGRNATPAQAGEAHAHIRARLHQTWGAGASKACHIIYGGSVKPDNIKDLVAIDDVDGALVGGASLDPQAFFQIVSRSREV